MGKNETVVHPPILREITHLFSDQLPEPGTVRTYSFEEIFAEKIRAMGDRCRPRDLYDVVNIFRRGDFRKHSHLVYEILIAKCDFKSIPVPTFELLETSPFRAELTSEWEHMLGHQLPELPPIGPFWEELEALLAWLEGMFVPEELTPIEVEVDEDPTWTPPPTIATWGLGVPVETIRFAAANHLCIELGYHGSRHIVEPYSLRRTQDGNLILHGIRTADRGHRRYRVDRMEFVRVTNQPFNPQHAIEFSHVGPITSAPTTTGTVSRPTRKRASRGRMRNYGGVV